MILYCYELQISRVATTLNIKDASPGHQGLSFVMMPKVMVFLHIFWHIINHRNKQKFVTTHAHRRTYPYDHSLSLDYLTYSSLVKLCHKILVTK